MTLALYMDVHVPREITSRLRAKGVDGLTAQDDRADELPDEQLLARASSLGRALFTQDQDFLVIAANRQRDGLTLSPIFFGRHDPQKIRAYADCLEIYATLGTLADLVNTVTFLQ